MSWLYSLVFAGLLFSTGSDSITVTTTADPAAPAVMARVQDVTERFEQTYPLNANGRVSVSNVNGSIVITAWDRKEVRLVAIKTADTKERLADVQIRVDSKPEYLQVETDYNDWKWKEKDKDKEKSGGEGWRDQGRLTVDYELSVPRTAMLNEVETVNGSVTVSDFVNFTKISAVNGSVRATNLRGTATLSTVNGEVAADFERLESTSNISLETVNGKVNLLIPSDSSATVKAESLNGSIINDFGLPVRKGKYVGRDLYGRLGSGDVSIKLESVNGGLSVKRRNDGRPLSPATNLLPQKAEDEDWDSDNDQDVESSSDAMQKDKGAIHSARQKQREAAVAIREAQRSIVKVKPDLEKITQEALKSAKIAIDTKELQKTIKESMAKEIEVMAALRDANFVSSLPRIESKSDSIPVKGIPKVTVDAKGCSVRVRGWDKQEVQYSVTQFSNNRTAEAIQMTEDHSDSAVNIKIANNTREDQSGFFLIDSTRIRIEIFVPRRSNLKIISNAEIRVEGVSGELEITGSDESVNIRDSAGKLFISNTDGRMRVIGFNGEVTAQTVDGDVYLEGNFPKLNGKAASGTLTLTLPASATAEFSSNTEVESNGFELVRAGSRTWRLGSGGPKYNFDFADGKLIVRNSSLLTSN